MAFTTRTHCIICSSVLREDYFDEDMSISTATYCIGPEEPNGPLLPYNIHVCGTCYTAQTKYLGDPSEIYRQNHADGTGKTMRDLYTRVSTLMYNNKDKIQNILEVGSANGVLCDTILSLLPSVGYTIIDPAYMGKTEGRRVIHSMYEDVNDTEITADTLVISHVFEHFYNPVSILQKVQKNRQIQNIVLVWPDMDYYLRHNVLHVLNTEHTYYMSGQNLLHLFENHGFTLSVSEEHMGHSQIYFLQRRQPLHPPRAFQRGTVMEDLDTYFGVIQKNVDHFNRVLATADKPVYLWPSSIHTIFLFTFGLSVDKCVGMLDNSPLKIGKKLYAYNKMCRRLPDVLDEECVVILNGGVFNKEVQSLFSGNNISVVLPLE